MTTPNTPAPWMTDEEASDISWKISLNLRWSKPYACKRTAITIRNMSSAHYEPLLAEAYRHGHRQGWLRGAQGHSGHEKSDTEAYCKAHNFENLRAQLAAKEKDNENLRELLRQAKERDIHWESGMLKIGEENATLKAEVERLKGENERLNITAQGVYEMAANESIVAQMGKDGYEAELTRLKADVTGFAEWILAEGYHPIHHDRKNLWSGKYMGDEFFTTSELYQEYLKTKV